MNNIPLKRTRAKRSCDFCRKRKARCDADDKTPCSNCKAWGFNCEFLTVCRKRGPPSVYVKNLESKCKKMELLLSSLTKKSIKELEKNNYFIQDNEKEELNDLTDENSSDIEKEEEKLIELDTEDYDNLKYIGKSAYFQSFDLNLFKSNDFINLPGKQNLSLKLVSENEVLFIKSNERKLNTRLDIGFSLNSSIFDENKQFNIMNEFDSNSLKKNIPSDKLLEKTFNLYFTHIHQFLPLIDRNRFEIQDIKSFNILSNAVLAVTFRFASCYFPKVFNSRKASFYAEIYYKKVKSRLKDSYRPRLKYVQAALLLTLYLDMDESDVDSIQWYMLGKAIRMAQDMGLHRSCKDWDLPPSEIETRHRVFYCCYILDRLMGARSGKPLTILDRDFDTDFPLPHELNNPLNFGPPIYQPFLSLIELSEIYGRVLKALYAPQSKRSNSNASLDDPTILSVMNRRLKYWRKTLETLNLTQAQKVNLLLFYYTVIILLHRPFLDFPILNKVKPSENSISLDLVASESRQICENAAHSISSIVQQKQGLMNDPDSYAPLCLPTCFVYSMFQSALIHLTLAIKNKQSSIYPNQLYHSIELLKQYEHLVAARRACAILDILIQINHIDMSNLPKKDPGYTNHSSLSQSPPLSMPSIKNEKLLYLTDDDIMSDSDPEKVPKSSWYMTNNQPVQHELLPDLHPTLYPIPTSFYPPYTTPDVGKSKEPVYHPKLKYPHPSYPPTTTFPSFDSPKPTLGPSHFSPMDPNLSTIPLPDYPMPNLPIQSSSSNWNDWDNYLDHLPSK